MVQECMKSIDFYEVPEHFQKYVTNKEVLIFFYYFYNNNSEQQNHFNYF